MAKVIKPTGEIFELMPENEKFTIEELSKLLGGLVAILFIEDKWIFVNKNGLQLKFEYNVNASKYVGFHIYGYCIIAKQNELPSQFFMVNEEEMTEDQDTQDLEPSQVLETQEGENMELLISDMCEKAYTELIAKNRPYDKLDDRFVIYSKDNYKAIVESFEDRIKVIDTMIDYFSGKEEYEKCSRILNLKKYLIKKVEIHG